MSIGTAKGSVMVVVIAVALVCLPWLVLLFGNAAKIGSKPLFPYVVALFVLLPLYPLYGLAKKWPGLRPGLLTLAAYLLVTLVVTFLYYVLHIDNPWVERMFGLSQILFVVAGLLLVWQAARRRG